MPSPKILIADDEPDIREMLGDFLKGEGFECLLAANAYEAMEKFKANPEIDIIMSDIRMPGKSGIDLLSEIKEIDENVMVIMISAVKDIESAIASMSRGAYDYVAKPFKLNEVSFVANRAIEKRRLILENLQYQKRLEGMVEERTNELRYAIEQLNKAYNAILVALVNALDTRDTETQGHSIRVVRYTLKLAEMIGIRDHQKLRVFKYGALLHDIGKIGIPDAILKKTCKLDQKEWTIMKNHPMIGFRMLQDIGFLREASQIVLHHHESFAGGGYPDGLTGELIPLGARIFKVADTLDAITSNRPYRRAKDFPTAAAEIKESSGSELDPLIVDAFFSVDLSEWMEEKGRIEIKGDQSLEYF